MSYVRWSSALPITEPCGTCGRPPVDEFSGETPGNRALAAYKYQERWAKGPLVRLKESYIGQWILWRKDVLRRNRFAWWFYRLADRGLCRECTSSWYVYWSTGSGDSRDTQLLAVWCCNSDATPVMDYKTVRSIVDRDAWRAIPGYPETGGQGVLEDCLREWLSDVEEQYPDPEHDSQREAS